MIDFNALLSSSPNPYVVLDREMVIVWMNEAYLRSTMRTREDITGRNMFDAFPSEPGTESHDMLYGSLQRVLATDTIDEIALIPYAIQQPDGTMVDRFWSATHVPLFGEDGRTTFIMQHTVDVTELEGLRRWRDEVGLVRRAEAVQARNLGLQAEAERLHRLFVQAPGFMAVLAGPRHVFQLSNDAYRALVGREQLEGLALADAMPEVVDQGFIALLDEVMRTGQPFIGKAVPMMLGNPEHGPLGQRYLDFIYQPILAPDGTVSGVFVQGHDVSEQVEADRRQRLLIDELNHRVKNMLAIVQGLAAQSFRGLPQSGDARRAFDSRLKALATAHDLLTRRTWQPTPLRDTIEATIVAATGDDAARFALSGAEVLLPAQTAVAMAMAIHELSTNAIKYGALSTPQGRIAIAWTLEQVGGSIELAMEWRETGGPPVSPPSRRGFGTRLIESGFATEHKGRAGIEFARDGLVCRIGLTLPVESVQAVSG